VLRANGPAHTGADSAAVTPGRDSQPFGFNHGTTAAQPTTPATALPNGASDDPAMTKGGRGAAPPSTTARALDQRAAPAVSGNTLSPAAIRAEIAAIKRLTLGEQTALEAVRRAEAILPELKTGEDSAEVLLHEFDAYVIRNDSSRSCNALKRIGTRGNSIVRESVVSGLSNC